MTMDTPPKTGDRIPGGYDLGEAIGAGPFAAVFDATAQSGEAVAVKVLKSQDPAARKHFQREAAILSALPKNEHLVGYLGKGSAGPFPFLVMERVRGVTLGHILRAGRRFDENAACSLMLQLCDAIAVMHKLGLAHCDIEPDNIILSRVAGGPDQPSEAPVRVRLLDFDRVRDAQGLLRLFESEKMLPGHAFQEELDFTLDTACAEFVAPEQFWDSYRKDGEAQTDTPADVFALGVIFYELLMGRSPWPFEPHPGPGDTRGAQLRAYLRRRCGAGYTLERPEAIGAPLWSIIAKALDRDPKRRQRDARELAADLKRYLHLGVGVAADLDQSETVMAVLPDADLSEPPPTPRALGPSKGPLASRAAPTTLSEALETAYGESEAEIIPFPAERPEVAPAPPRAHPAQHLRTALWVASGFAAGLAAYIFAPF